MYLVFLIMFKFNRLNRVTDKKFTRKWNIAAPTLSRDMRDTNV